MKAIKKFVKIIKFLVVLTNKLLVKYVSETTNLFLQCEIDLTYRNKRTYGKKSHVATTHVYKRAHCLQIKGLQTSCITWLLSIQYNKDMFALPVPSY